MGRIEQQRLYCMETPQMKLEKAWSMLPNSSINEGLNALLQKMESKTVEEIIRTEENDELRRIDCDIRKLCVSTTNQESEEIAELIFTGQSYLKRGIQDADLKSILIFLSVNSYLKLGIKKLLTEDELLDHSTQLLCDAITKLLQQINPDVKPLPDAPYYEIEMMKSFQQGISDNDINNTYQFVEAYERGGCGFHFNFLLEHLISFLYELNYSCFLSYISKIDNPINIIFNLQSFNIERLIRLSNESLLINTWLNFELIRQIIEKEQKDGFEEVECIAIKNILLKISDADFNFLKQCIQYFHRSKLFNAALGESLVILSKANLQEILSDCFVINKGTSQYEARKELLEHFRENASNHQMDVLLETVYNKWDSYFNGLFNSDDFYLNDVLFTDFCDFVALYFIQIAHEVDITGQIPEILKQLIWIDSEWFPTESKQITIFYLLYSKLYLLSFAYREKQLRDAHITALFSRMQQDKILLSRYFKGDKMKSLHIMDENLNW